MAKKLLLFWLALSISACTAAPTLLPSTPVGQIDNEQPAVYAFLLSQIYRNHAYVIMSNTATGPTGVDQTAQTLDYVLQNMHAVDPATVSSFESRNDRAYPLRSDLDLGSSYTLLTQSAKNEIFALNQSGWDIFYNRFPQAPGITTLSQVGFNTTLDQALLYIGTNSNWQAGAGYYILLEKIAGNWTIDQRVLLWGS